MFKRILPVTAPSSSCFLALSVHWAVLAVKVRCQLEKSHFLIGARFAAFKKILTT
jgi:hypothetical protein